MLSQWYDPRPGSLITSLAWALRDQGHQVEVLTGIPYDESGSYVDGYRFRWRYREWADGISIVRVPLYPSHDKSGLRRTLTYASFALTAAAIGTPSVARPDVVYVYHPPATVGLPARALRFFRKAPFVYHIQDLWPDTLPATGMVSNGAILSLVDAWCRRVYRAAAELIVLSPGFKRRLVERGVPEGKIHVVYNWARPLATARQAPDEDVLEALRHPAGTFNILFAGNMGMAQGLEAVIDAARLLVDERPGIRFVFIGSGVKVGELKAHAEAVGARNVLFLRRQAPSQMPDIFAQADALLVHLRDDPLFSITIPSKTQDYLSVGKPILMGVRGDAAELVRRAQAGVICEPENPRSIAEAAKALFDTPEAERRAMGRRGRTFYERELSEDIGARRIAQILARAANG